MKTEIKKITKFYIEEFTVEISTSRFNFEKNKHQIQEDIEDYTDFTKGESQKIAEEVTKRLRGFAEAIKAAKQAAIG